MKVIDPGTQQLPNGLILDHITNLEARYTSQQRLLSIPPNLRAALRDVKTNLSRPPTADAADIPQRGAVPKKHVVRLTEALTGREFRLLSSEALMVLNHRPVTKEELAGLVEELDERMSEEKQDKLLAVVAKEFAKVKAVDVELLEGNEFERAEEEIQAAK